MKRILVVDDDEQIRSMMLKILQIAGYEVSGAVNGEQAIRIFYEKPADLLITDMLMPVMSGSKLISTLKGNFPDLKIIAISGGGRAYQPENYLAYAKEIGAHKILKKPTSRCEILQAVKDVLEL